MSAALRLAPLIDAQAAVRKSVRVRRICEFLDCDPSQVYRLIDAGVLETHPFGKRGIRVYLDSMEAYRARGGGDSPPKGSPELSRRPAPASKAAHNVAVAQLRERGLV